MKKIVLGILSVVLFQTLNAKNVKFSVDMTGQIKSAFGIHVMGDFQATAGLGADWTPGSCTMIQDATDTNIYHFGVNIPAFQKYEFKFVNGDQSYEVEIVPAVSQVGYSFVDNRWIYIDSLDADTMELSPVLFSQNAPTGLYAIRFLVDMSLQTVSANGVHVAGGFQFTNPLSHRMYSFVNNIYEIISYVDNLNYGYKFYNGNLLINTESVPLACADVNGDRTFSLNQDTILNNVCFNSCSTCFPASVSNFSLQHQISIFPNPANDVVNISFNDNEEIHHIAIADLKGKIIDKQLNINSKETIINTSTLSNGIYYLIVSNNKNQRVSKTLIIE
ncbi:MAG: T9SS type A sorting domain-containing protein [Chitinophagaceae bacterium]|nr:T9SS type A sorting domain-containing protein [Chitinophagaceae bacterium]